MLVLATVYEYISIYSYIIRCAFFSSFIIELFLLCSRQYRFKIVSQESAALLDSLAQKETAHLARQYAVKEAERKIQIHPADVSFLCDHLDLRKETAETCLRKYNGSLDDTLRELVLNFPEFYDWLVFPLLTTKYKVRQTYPTARPLTFWIAHVIRMRYGSK